MVGVVSSSSLMARQPDVCIDCCTVTTTAGNVTVTIPLVPPVTAPISLPPVDSCVADQYSVIKSKLPGCQYECQQY